MSRLRGTRKETQKTPFMLTKLESSHISQAKATDTKWSSTMLAGTPSGQMQ